MFVVFGTCAFVIRFVRISLSLLYGSYPLVYGLCPLLCGGLLSRQGRLTHEKRIYQMYSER